MAEKKNDVCEHCRKTTQYSNWSRQCFMTGEQCSKQSMVHNERKLLHDKKEINAFVIMNFSDMSDVVYKWKLSGFIESLKDYLYLNNTTNEIVCIAEKGNTKALPDLEKGEGVWEPVTHINVIRADSNTASNYIICNRVCQQMQIADLVIVDVSVENTNVFYEFGMAAAFGKLILPICYNESFYHFSLPEGAEECLEKRRKDLEKDFHRKDSYAKEKKDSLESFRKMVEHHIDCYPWRRKLFEYYGIRYRSHKSQVGYTYIRDIINPLYGYQDMMYNQFPYDARIDRVTGERATKDKQGETVGTLLYSRLSDSYGNDTISGKYNTVVIYTMDSTLNETQAGQCIINYYKNMTAQIWYEFCFCGDRVGVMGQANAIHDDPKDTKTNQKLLYRVGDVIRIGMNEATHLAQKQRIKTSDYLLGVRETIPENDRPLSPAEEWNNKALRFTKGHVRNRCIPIYPDEPIYVQELLEGVQKGILSDNVLEKKRTENGFDYKHFFCLFHVTLHTLRYTNELVVDLSRNSLQALFWLGVAHGRNAQAITVRHAPTEEELRLAGISELPVERNIFDVAGLWTAILHSNNTDGFYHQLAMAQIGIEQYSKLALPEAEIEQYKEAVLDEFYEASPYRKFGFERLTERITAAKRKQPTADNMLALNKELHDILNCLYSNERMKQIWKTLSSRNRKESERLESYYRSLFWKRMLRYNELKLYSTQHDGSDRESRAPRRVSITWDVDATSELSHYLSKRTTIGRYRFRALREGEIEEKSQESNFICIGAETVPMARTGDKGGPLVRHIRSKIPESGKNVVRHLAFCENKCAHAPGTDSTSRSYRGFFSQDGTNNVFAQFANAHCTGNLVSDKPEDHLPVCKEFSKNVSKEYVPIKKHFKPVTPNTTWEKTGKGTFELPPDVDCQLCQNKQSTYEQLAQLILWRETPEDPKDQNEKVKYWVSLIGVSGPATLALTSLLVNDDQKQELFGRQGEKKTLAALPLNTLQTEIRKSLMEHYENVLIKQLGKRGLSSLCRRVCYATKLYLSTVLYQYFFPFLSKADEKRICNGMHAYVSSGGFIDLFGKDHKMIEEAITLALEETISSFMGVEALYTVEVEYGNEDKDDRRPKDIHLLKKPDNNGVPKPMISCLFAESPFK